MAVPGVIERARGALLGAFTGDTEMMIVLAEHLARHDGVDAPALAEAVLSRHDPQRGYGSRWWPRAVKVTPWPLRPGGDQRVEHKFRVVALNDFHPPFVAEQRQ